MSDERDKSLGEAASWLRATFWDEVEREVETLDWLDFIEFLEADGLELPVRAEFQQELRGRLREFIRLRYAQ
jgi:hypothetical protein